ncbi:hypothetical protein AB0F77_03570 [Streptomyces sp. NPDC026672]|uniref:hypothetical protein n=1 Tax=unclassified Streptomyces TaxID=2593676 RepID=UPI0033CCD102
MARPRHPGRLVMNGVAALAAGLLTAACSAQAAPAPAPRDTTAPAPAAVTYRAPDDVTRMLFPATGAETRWTQGLDALGQQVAGTVTVTCARRAGRALPEQPPPAFIRLFEVPDLDFVARHGFSRSAPVPAPGPVSGPAGGTRATTAEGCRKEGAAAAADLHDRYGPLQRLWFGALSTLDRGTRVRDALGTLPDCLAGRGIKVGDENAFFVLVDSRLAAAPAADRARLDRDLGRAYADCMRPVEAVRDSARLRLREEFLREHAGEVTALRRTLPEALHDTERRYGLRLAFPAP